MVQSKMMKRWTPRYFVLENGYLSYYDKKSLVGTKKRKVRCAARCDQAVVQAKSGVPIPDTPHYTDRSARCMSTFSVHSFISSPLHD